LYERGAIRDSLIAAVVAKWDDNSAASIVEVLKSVVERNPFRRDLARGVLSGLAIGVFVLFVLWVLLVAQVLPFSKLILSLGFILGVSALLGVTGRTALRVLHPQEFPFSKGLMVGEVVLSLVLSIALVALYIAVRGTSNFTQSDFLPHAISFTFIGLAAGLSQESVRKYVEKILPGKAIPG
jgi:hypothetical protein